MRTYQKQYKTINNKKGTNITLRVDIEAIMSETSAELRRLGEEAALRVMYAAMERERERIVSLGAGYRHGEQRGWAAVNGQKIPTRHLRARGSSGEIELESYKLFQNTDEMSARAYNGLMRGMSARDYSSAAKDFASGYGLSKTAADNHFIRVADAKLRELLERDLSDKDIVAIFMDGKVFGDNMIIAAIGVCSNGEKSALGIWQGTTENTEVCRALIKDLIRRGLNADKQYLFVIDGGKGLRAAIIETFGGNAFVQRCQQHKIRNVAGHLPDELQHEYRRKISAAYGMSEYEEARVALMRCVKELERRNPSAANSLREGLDETLTLHRLGLPDVLRKSMKTTNCIESAFSQVEGRTGRVKRWRDGIHAQRWAGCALLMAEDRWHKISGWKLLGKLPEAMERQIIKRKEAEKNEAEKEMKEVKKEEAEEAENLQAVQQ